MDQQRRRLTVGVLLPEPVHGVRELLGILLVHGMAGIGPTLRFDDVERPVAKCPEIVRSAPERVFWPLSHVTDVQCEIMHGLFKLRGARSPVEVL